MRNFINIVLETIQETQSLVNRAKTLGVDLNLFDCEDYIELHWIERTTGEAGAGAEVMDLLCSYADSVHKPILLDTDVGNPDMKTYFENWGFVDFDAANAPDHYPDWQTMMIREPASGLTESVAMRYMGQYSEKEYPIYKNANRTVFENLENSTKFGVRGLLDTQRGDLYFWDAYAAVHFTIKNQLGLVEPLHLNMWPDSIVILPPRGAHSGPLTEDMKTLVSGNRYVQRLYGKHPQVFLSSENEE